MHGFASVCKPRRLGTFLVLLAFALWMAAIVGIILLVGYGVLLALLALSSAPTHIQQGIGLAVMSVAATIVVVWALSERPRP